MNRFLTYAVEPREEMIAYETLWALDGSTLKRVADFFRTCPGLPSHLLAEMVAVDEDVPAVRTRVEAFLANLRGFMVSVNGAFQYPAQLQDARHPIHLFYYRGYIALTETPCVSVVGAREASPEGMRRADRLARELVAAGYTIVSGLAKGIDTAAMQAALDAGGHTIGVIGTPITESYPRANADLQECIASKKLLISQVPFYRYAHQAFSTRKVYFPERNETMAALSQATIIVEASDTSGSLTQARAALQQRRKLFILNSCFENPEITWPATFEARGAIRVRTAVDILDALGRANGGTDVEEN